MIRSSPAYPRRVPRHHVVVFSLGAYNLRMGPLGIRALMRRTTHRFGVLLAVLALAGAVVVHHAEPPGAMGGMHGEHAMAAAAMCAGTVVGALAIVGLIATVLLPRRTRRPLRRTVAVVVRLVSSGALPRARSSPLYLRYAVLRR